MAGKIGIGKAEMASKSCPPDTVEAVVLLRGQGRAVRNTEEMRSQFSAAWEGKSVSGWRETAGQAPSLVLLYLFGETALEFVAVTASQRSRRSSQCQLIIVVCRHDLVLQAVRSILHLAAARGLARKVQEGVIVVGVEAART